ncbi:F-box/LRR-repeat protein At1g55660-like [Salvia hispanica]|uniref:F-box/LRR-repeat protein At1g55660-like n=1 Tax=Salvia hispanica TaxID=49212 RepID=UPI002008F34F|nr:F-box/LRR-repeat protein At1g55660-like [Salvia hispanica]
MEEDKISQLPDDILLLILDKIDTSQAVETMILSHRWKNVWRSLPGLRFHFSFAASVFPDPPLVEECDRQLQSHRKFVSQFLSRRDAAAALHDFHISLDKLSFQERRIYIYDAHREFMDECFLYAANHGVQSLRLEAPNYPNLWLPEALISCKTLRELRLEGNPVKFPGSLSLPNLKTFHLEGKMVFDDDRDRREPFSGLPELEELTLKTLSFDVIALKAPKLRVFEITCIWIVAKEVSAPLLTSFSYNAFEAWECEKVNLPMLEQVHLDIHDIGDDFDQMQTNFVRMFHQCRNATTVSLTLDTLQALERYGGPFEQTPPPFPNMKCLKVIEGLNKTHKVFRRVMNYLTGTLCCEVKLPPSMVDVEQMSNYDEDNCETFV